MKSRFKSGEFEATKRRVEAQITATFDKFLATYDLSHQAEHVHLLNDETGAGHAISTLAKQAGIDLIVMGTIARTGMAGALMGNTAEQVLDQAECAVLTIKPNEFISPVTLAEKTV